MTGEGMTSVSVSYETRRQLNTMRTNSGHQSGDDLLKALIKEHKINRMQGNVDKLRERVDDIAAVDVEHLVQRLNLSPFRS